MITAMVTAEAKAIYTVNTRILASEKNTATTNASTKAVAVSLFLFLTATVVCNCNCRLQMHYGGFTRCDYGARVNY